MIASNAKWGWVRFVFYRPGLWIGNLFFWGFRPGVFRRSVQFQNISDCILPTEESNSVIPLAMVFHSVIPETKYSITKMDSPIGLHPSERIAWCEGSSTKGLVVDHQTNSYFHFVTEIIPLALHYGGEDSVGVIVRQDWQVEALECFGLELGFRRPDRTKSLHSLRKERWGVFPREDLLIEARTSLTEATWLSRHEPSLSPDLLVNRSGKTSTTGRLLSHGTKEALKKQLKLNEYDPALYPIRQQYLRFSESNVFVGPHGSAFANLIAAKEKSVVIEINHVDKAQWHIKRLCDIFNFSYKLCLASTDASGTLDLDVSLIGVVEDSLIALKSS